MSERQPEEATASVPAAVLDAGQLDELLRLTIDQAPHPAAADRQRMALLLVALATLDQHELLRVYLGSEAAPLVEVRAWDPDGPEVEDFGQLHPAPALLLAHRRCEEGKGVEVVASGNEAWAVLRGEPGRPLEFLLPPAERAEDAAGRWGQRVRRWAAGFTATLDNGGPPPAQAGASRAGPAAAARPRPAPPVRPVPPPSPNISAADVNRWVQTITQEIVAAIRAELADLELELPPPALPETPSAEEVARAVVAALPEAPVPVVPSAEEVARAVAGALPVPVVPTVPSAAEVAQAVVAALPEPDSAKSVEELTERLGRMPTADEVAESMITRGSLGAQLARGLAPAVRSAADRAVEAALGEATVPVTNLLSAIQDVLDRLDSSRSEVRMLLDQLDRATRHGRQE